MKAFFQFPNFAFFLFLILYSFSWAQNTIPSEMSMAKTEKDTSLVWGPCPEFMPEGCSITVLHGNPAERNSDILLKIPANSVIPNHTHTSAERMILISGELEVTYEGEESQKLIAGSYAYGSANKPHSARCGDSPCILFVAFEEPLDAILTSKN